MGYFSFRRQIFRPVKATEYHLTLSKKPSKIKFYKTVFSHQAKPQQKESNWLRPQWFGGGSRCQKPIYKPEATFDDTGTYCVIARYGKALVSFL